MLSKSTTTLRLNPIEHMIDELSRIVIIWKGLKTIEKILLHDTWSVHERL